MRTSRAWLILVIVVSLSAQQEPRQWWEILGGWSLMQHRATMPVYEEQPHCGVFTGGRSSGILFGAGYQREILPWVEGNARVLVWHCPARLELVTDNGLEAYDPDQNHYVPFVRRHVWSAQLWYAGIELSGRVYPLRAVGVEVPVWVRVGATVAHPVFGADYEQTEEIVQPRVLLFPDGTRRHTVASGAIADAATTYDAVATIGATIPLRRRMDALIEVGFRYGLASLRSTQDWKVNAGFVAVGVRFDLSAEQPPPPPPIEPPPPPPPPLPPTVTLTQATPEPIVVHEAIVTETFPLLPYVFFDSASSQLPVRYMPLVEPERFAESQLPRSTLGIYYHLLHVLGRRLANDTGAVLTIVGTTDGVEVPPSQQPALARARAEAIASYLRSVWRVRPSQLIATTSPQPSIPSNPAYPEGLVENRRAELFGNSLSLFAPIVHERFSEYIVERRRIV
ncbi:MAG: hypothetical protein N2663_04490, partial [Chlorobi bacterium]|nr:hypothetical protein [Chlorobiota bacterium]